MPLNQVGRVGGGNIKVEQDGQWAGVPSSWSSAWVLRLALPHQPSSPSGCAGSLPGDAHARSRRQRRPVRAVEPTCA